MWEQFGLVITDFDERPSRGAKVAASFRQLLRAYEAGDAVAVWLASSTFGVSIRLFLNDLLSHEPAWDVKGRWLDGLSEHKFLFRRPVRVRLSCSMVWGLRANVGGRQWAEPFEADLELTPDLSDLASYTIRFSDKRTFPGEDLQSNLSRISEELETGAIVWGFEFRK